MIFDIEIRKNNIDIIRKKIKYRNKRRTKPVISQEELNTETNNFIKDNFPNEEFKDIKGYENIYKVSNKGTIIRCSTNRKIGLYYSHDVVHKMNQRLDRRGYKIVHIIKDNSRNYKYVHRIVAETFIPNPNNLPEINHKDENKQNNAIENLEWCTSKYNSNYGTRTKRIKLKTGKKVKVYDIKTNKLKDIVDSVTECTKKYNVSPQAIYMDTKYKRTNNNTISKCYFRIID